MALSADTIELVARAICNRKDDPKGQVFPGPAAYVVHGPFIKALFSADEDTVKDALEKKLPSISAAQRHEVWKKVACIDAETAALAYGKMSEYMDILEHKGSTHDY